MDLGRKGVGLREQIVAEEDRRLVAPHVVERLHLPPQERFVEDVVVHQRRGVEHLDDGGERDVDVGDLAAEDVSRMEEQGGADPLALEFGRMLEKLGDERVLMGEFALEGDFEAVDLRLDGFVDALQRGGGLTQASSLVLSRKGLKYFALTESGRE